MNRDAVQRAILQAAQEAFQAGQRQAGKRAHGGTALAAALTYAEQLVMPMVELAIAQAAEEGATSAIRARLDPEPDLRPAAFP